VPPRHRFILTAVLTTLVGIIAAAGLVLGLAGPAPADTSSPTPTGPPGDTVVAITGDASNGFDISYYDCSTLLPPTSSEAAAECSEYDTRVARVRCRAEVRVWYREIAVTQQALAWAHTA